MVCCTLIAFLFGQLGVVAGAVKVRFFDGGNFATRPSGIVHTLTGRWLWVGLAAGLSFELLLPGAAAPYIMANLDRVEAVQSLAGAWHLCSFGASIAANVFQRPTR